MSDNAAQLIREVVAKGYQIEPKAFNLLLQMSKETNVGALIEEVIKLKGEEGDRTIKAEDIQRFTTKKDTEMKIDETELNEPLNFKVLQNYEKVKAADGVEGFRQLFLSRYQKLLALAKKRRDSGNIESITRLEDSKLPMKVAGLIYSKTIKKGSA
ncbi:MAG: hypothetical protein QXY08_02875, partial [Nitrososphaerales archaeon]